MGIVNITPDSFYEPSRNQSISDVLKVVENMLKDGAEIIDLGAFSTRPGAKAISEDEELERVSKIVQAVMQHFPNLILSVDTFRTAVAKACIDEGVSLINDVSFAANEELIQLCVRHTIPYVLMHVRGTPTTMMNDTAYHHVVKDVFQEMDLKINELKWKGLNDVIVDPGFGFSKTIEQNYEIMKDLSFFKQLQKPILVGISRKSMIYKLLETSPEESLNGTVALNTFALLNGASILRVHDVKPAVEVREIVRKLF